MGTLLKSLTIKKNDFYCKNGLAFRSGWRNRDLEAKDGDVLLLHLEPVGARPEDVDGLQHPHHERLQVVWKEDRIGLRVKLKFYIMNFIIHKFEILDYVWM